MDLREIVARHAKDGACACGAGDAERESHTPWCPARARPDQRHIDRGALLDLLRRVARPNHEADCSMMGCHWCALGDDMHHAPDCPAPLLEALR